MTRGAAPPAPAAALVVRAWGRGTTVLDVAGTTVTLEEDAAGGIGAVTWPSALACARCFLGDLLPLRVGPGAGTGASRSDRAPDPLGSTACGGGGSGGCAASCPSGCGGCVVVATRASNAVGARPRVLVQVLAQGASAYGGVRWLNY